MHNLKEKGHETEGQHCARHVSPLRRSFLKNSALATAALTVSPSALFADVLKPASSKSIVAICENLKAITEASR